MWDLRFTSGLCIRVLDTLVRILLLDIICQPLEAISDSAFAPCMRVCILGLVFAIELFDDCLLQLRKYAWDYGFCRNFLSRISGWTVLLHSHLPNSKDCIPTCS